MIAKRVVDMVLLSNDGSSLDKRDAVLSGVSETMLLSVSLFCSDVGCWFSLAVCVAIAGYVS